MNDAHANTTSMVTRRSTVIRSGVLRMLDIENLVLVPGSRLNRTLRDVRAEQLEAAVPELRPIRAAAP